jgi:hypothetical protein
MAPNSPNTIGSSPASAVIPSTASYNERIIERSYCERILVRSSGVKGAGSGTVSLTLTLING